jgi:flagellar hook-associated protein 1 FlgK
LLTTYDDNGNAIDVYQLVEPDIADIYNPQEKIKLYTIDNISLNPTFRDTAGLSLLSFSLSGAVDDITLVNQIMDTWKGQIIKLPNVEGKFSIDAAYISMLTTLGDQKYEASHNVEKFTTEAQEKDHKRKTIMDVSMDEELSTMLVMQHAFNANARMVNALDSMLETIINMAR